MAAFICGSLFQASCRVAMVEPPVFYLELMVLAAARRTGVSIGTAGCAYLARRAPSLRPLATSCPISTGLRPTWPKKKPTPDELETRGTTRGRHSTDNPGHRQIRL